jgi:Dyp-type peroxidase family
MTITRAIRERTWDVVSNAVNRFCHKCSPYSPRHVATSKTLELADIQGIVVRGYGKLRAAAFVLLEVTDAEAARRWLGSLADEVMDSRERPEEACVNLAMTHAGLAALGLSPAALGSFALEFRQGMAGANEHRSRILGDVGDNAPEHWRWGGPSTEAVHVALLLYALDEEKLAAYYQGHEARFAAGGVAVVQKLDTVYIGRNEHFGFRDGIGQPVIAGYKEGSEGNSINPGEFLLGYENEYGALPPSPIVDAASDPHDVLPPAPGGEGKDLGKNGSYLVFRQLSQDVQAFWRFADRHAKGDPAERVRLASKMVGRWPGGAPMALSPDQDDPSLSDSDDFLYYPHDAHGYNCPIGSHVRRTNPRDSLEPNPGSQESLKVGKRHRIIRRGRAYGPPVAESMDPDEILEQDAGDAERGLHFLCFNTNITRQFEFIQFTWSNSKKFDGLYNDADPLIGEHNPEQKEGVTGDFNVQARPVRQRLTGLTRFVNVKGGGYFFLPGKTAIRYLASLPDQRVTRRT